MLEIETKAPNFFTCSVVQGGELFRVQCGFYASHLFFAELSLLLLCTIRPNAHSSCVFKRLLEDGKEYNILYIFVGGIVDRFVKPPINYY